MGVGLPVGRRGHGLCSRGRGPPPTLVLPLPCPTGLGQGVLATATWGPWAGPHARGGELCIQAHQGGCSPPSGPVFVMISMLALP